ncbi:unnamed protein product, partial [Ectocarpus sp. 13 AM-2016]
DLIVKDQEWATPKSDGRHYHMLVPVEVGCCVFLVHFLPSSLLSSVDAPLLLAPTLSLSLLLLLLLLLLFSLLNPLSKCSKHPFSSQRQHQSFIIIMTLLLMLQLLSPYSSIRYPKTAFLVTPH